MKQQALSLGGIPALLWGEPSKKVLLAIHGQGGEHWFHTPEQLKFLSDWYQENLEE